MLIDYEGFKVKMRRRIDSLIKRNNYDDYDNYYKALTQDSKLYNEFVNYLTINVSEFYRNPNQWEILEKEIIPEILKHNKKPKIWSAACSTGEEPYSLAMMMTRFMDLSNIKIIATDIDTGAIDKAKKGVYVPKSLINLPKDFVNNYFEKDGENLRISDKIKRCIDFKQHNLLKDKYMDGCDLIICRNVMIYFTEEAKSEMYAKFRDSLVAYGVLFVGSTEQIILPQRYKLEPAKTFFYKKA
jgi:chemotaxis protein methyltransferase CheR